MKCQSNISTFCKKNFKKSEVCYINKKEVCPNCYWLLKQKAKQKGKVGNPTGRNGRPQSGDHNYKLQALIQPFRKLLQTKKLKQHEIPKRVK